MATASPSRPWQDTDRPVDERVASLLAAMTLEQKAAQLGSYWAPHSIPGEDVAPMEGVLSDDTRPLSEYIADGLGHLTRVFGSRPVSVAEGVGELNDLQGQVIAAPGGLGIPAVAHEECLTGFTALGATVYPTPLAWGATFDPALIREMAAAIGRDMHDVGVQHGLAPVLDVTRDYRWGRTEETIGEDPYLVGTLGSAYVQGLQGAGVIATLKHFVGYSASRAARNHAPVAVGRRELADVLLVPFERAIRDGGARSVMNSYADLDGVPPGASRELLTDILRERWGFTGTVVSDYWAVTFLEIMHRVAADPADAARLALTAGMDVELPETGAFAHLPALVRSGRVDEDVLDEAVRRVLRQKAELGLLDRDWAPPAADIEVDLDRPANRALARRIAEESLVLLANDGTLPVSASPGRVALIGPSAGEPRSFLGCYSFPNHVLSRYPDGGIGIEIPDLAASLAAVLPGTRLTYEPGCDFSDDDRSGIPAAVAAAAHADLAIVTVGDIAGLFGRGTSGEGCDAPDLVLPGVQAELVEAVLATGTPVVLVLVSGRPYALGAFADRCAAIVQAFFPGEEGGPALAALLTGAVEPTGRLPVGVPRNPGGQPGTYLAAPLGQHAEGVSNLDPTPLFPFGHGLSYSSVAYGEIAVDRRDLPADGLIDVSVEVRNTGERPVAEVVQLYLSDRVAQVVRPVRELIGFVRVPLAVGETRRVTFTVDADRTSFTGLTERVVEPGTVTFAVGRSSADLVATVDVEITGSTRVITGRRVMDTPVRHAAV